MTVNVQALHRKCSAFTERTNQWYHSCAGLNNPDTKLNVVNVSWVNTKILHTYFFALQKNNYILSSLQLSPHKECYKKVICYDDHISFLSSYRFHCIVEFSMPLAKRRTSWPWTLWKECHIRNHSNEKMQSFWFETPKLPLDIIIIIHYDLFKLLEPDVWGK